MSSASSRNVVASLCSRGEDMKEFADCQEGPCREADRQMSEDSTEPDIGVMSSISGYARRDVPPASGAKPAGALSEVFFDCSDTLEREDSKDSDQESFDSMDVFLGQEKMPEPRRLARLLEIQQPYEDNGKETFQSMVELVQDTFDVPICLVSLVYEQFQWFKACVGLDVCQTPRETSFCAHTFLPLRPEVLYVPDATKDNRFRENVLVTGPPNIRFYCGAPLITHDNVRLGALCVIDSKPRTVTETEMKMLMNLAEVTVRELVKTEMGNKFWTLPTSAPYEVGTSCEDWRKSKIRQAWFNRVVNQCVIVLDATDSWEVLWSNPTWSRLWKPLTLDTFELGAELKVDPANLWSFVEPAHGISGRDLERMVLKRLGDAESSVSFMVQAIGPLQDGAPKLFSCSISDATKAPVDSVNPIRVPEDFPSCTGTPINAYEKHQLLMLILSPADGKTTEASESPSESTPD